MSLEPGTQIGPYTVLAAVAAGGMGEIYRARDERLDRDVALKILRRNLLEERERLQRFLLEAKTVAALNHPNVLTLHDFGESDWGPYLVTELVEGRTLREVVAQGPLEVDRALEIVTQIAEGLAKAHAAGIVHRDVKPENVMVTRDGLVKVLDFGLAKLRPTREALASPGVDQSLTATGVILGTPAYLSPEQLRGFPADARSDVFALGLVLYELIRGCNPFWRESAVETMNAILTEDIVPLASCTNVTGRVSDLVRRATAKDPSHRYANAQEMLSALQSQRGALSSEAVRHSWSRRAAWIGTAVVLLVFFAILGRDLVSDVSTTRMPDSATGTTGQPHPPAVPTITLPKGKMGVAIMPIVDESGDAQLASSGISRILADAFVQLLVDVPGLYVIDRHRLESIAKSLGGSLEVASHDREFAREVGTGANAAAILSGNLSRLGEVYILNATLTQIPSDVVLDSFRAQSESTTAILSQLTHRVSADLQQKYGTPSTAPVVERVATASLDAYAHYVRGDDLIHEGNWQAAVLELEEAVRVDPEMALAWSALSCALSFAGDETGARAASNRAMDLADRLNERQRRWVELEAIWVNTMDGDAYIEAISHYQRDYPDDHRSYLYTGLAWEWLKGDCESALASYTEAYSIVPRWYPITNARVDCLLKLGRKEEAKEVLREFLSLRGVAGHGRDKATWRLQELENRS